MAEQEIASGVRVVLRKLKEGEAVPGVQILKNPHMMTAFANLALVSTSPEEAFITFAERTDEDPNVGLPIFRIYLTIPHLKRLGAAIEETIQKHEQKFPEVKTQVEDMLRPELQEHLKATMQEMLAAAEAQGDE